MTVEKNPINGAWSISDVINGHLVSMQYFYYAKREAAAGEYEGVPEATSVLICGGLLYPLTIEDISYLSDALDQECVAAVLTDSGHAFGNLYGANPKGYVFDWAQFRI